MEISNISNMRRAEDCGSLLMLCYTRCETVYDTERALDKPFSGT